MSTWKHMSGAGNTFVVGLPEDANADGLDTATASVVVPSILRTHPRPDGRAIEGLLVVHPQSTTFSCDYYNPDGSHGMLCGNGARCAVRFAIDQGVTVPAGTLNFILNGQPYTSTMDAEPWPPDSIAIVVPAPTAVQLYAAGSLRGVNCDAYYVCVPNEHVVIDMPTSDIRGIVQAIRHHELFPRGVNVNMVAVGPDGVVNIATFERGVEAITGACGTGAVASAIALWQQKRTTDHVKLRPPSGRMLEVTIHHHNQVINNIELRGDVQYDA